MNMENVNMGKVLIIKNKYEYPNIYKYAKESYDEKKPGFYNTVGGMMILYGWK